MYPDWFVFMLSGFLGYLSLKDWIYLSISYYDIALLFLVVVLCSLYFYRLNAPFFISGFLLKVIILTITLFGYFLLIIDKKMGSGDFWVFFFIGFLLHYTDILESIYLSIVSGGVYSIILVLLDRKNLKKQIPFIPFLTIGFLLSILLDLL